MSNIARRKKKSLIANGIYWIVKAFLFQFLGCANGPTFSKKKP